MNEVCVVGCGREAAGMCSECWKTLRKGLGHVGWLRGQLDLLLSRQVRLGSSSTSAGGRGGSIPLPLGLKAIRPSDRLRNALTTWVRALHDRHAVRWLECDRCGARWHSGAALHVRPEPDPPCAGTWREVIDPLAVDDDVVELAKWLLRHPTWIRADPAADELHHDITSALDACWVAIDAPADLVYLGICSTTVFDSAGTATECPADLYGEQDQDVVRCHRCKTDHIAEDRRRVLARAVEDQVVETSVLVGLVDQLGRTLTSSAVRGLKARGSIQPKVRGEDGYVRLRQPGDEGPDTFRVGDVLDALAGRHRRTKVPVRSDLASTNG